MDPIILTDESLNSYGFRVLTQGADLSAFEKNPVLFFNHEAWGLPLGRWEGLSIDEQNRLIASPVFDDEDPKAQEVAGKYKRGFLNAASIGFQILATSEDPSDMLAGQTLPTVTKWRLLEASLASVPANANAVKLYNNEGQEIDLEDGQALSLALKTKSKKMEEKTVKNWVKDILLELGILKAPEPAPEAPEASAEPAPEAEAEQAPEAAAEPAEAPAPAVELQALEAELQALKDQISKNDEEIRALEQDKAQLSEEIQALKKTLSALPADEGPGLSPEDQKKQAQPDLMPQTLAAIKYFENLKKR